MIFTVWTDEEDTIKLNIQASEHKEAAVEYIFERKTMGEFEPPQMIHVEGDNEDIQSFKWDE